MAGEPLSANEATFLLQALLEGVRADGRALLERRAPAFSFWRREGRAAAEVRLERRCW